jgi:AAA family ATP:ADP antiporter
MKFRGKPAIDTLYVRLGDGLAAITVLAGIHVLAMSTRSFFVFNVLLVLCWLAFTLMMIREHRKASQVTG